MSSAPERPTPRCSPGECPHENFAARVDVHRLTKGDDGPVAGYSADITVECVDCTTPFEWMGLPAGLQPNRPTGSIDGQVMSAPLRPAGSPAEFGLDLPGFSVEVFVNDEHALEPDRG